MDEQPVELHDKLIFDVPCRYSFMSDEEKIPHMEVPTSRKLVVQRTVVDVTSEAETVMRRAENEARRTGHDFVGTEQVLLALIGVGSTVVARTLSSMGLKLKDARMEVEKIIGQGRGFAAKEIPLTFRAKRVMEDAWYEARQLGDDCISSEHILLGLIRQEEGVAVRVLRNLGIDKAKIRTLILATLKSPVNSG